MNLSFLNVAYQSLSRRWTETAPRGEQRRASGIGSLGAAARRRVTPSLWIGGALTLALLLVGVLGPALAPYAPETVMVENRLLPPSAAFPFGTDLLGRDMLSRVLHGARLAIQMAVLGVGISAGLGMAFGSLAGYFGGWFDQVISRGMEIWMAFPGLLLAIVIVARLGPSLLNAVFALGIVGVPAFFRLMRGATLSARGLPYVEAARAVGASDARVMWRHIFPNLLSPLIVLATSRLGIVILAGGGLSFIGLGAQPPQPEWGALLASARDFMDMAPWMAIFPGAAITLAVAGFNLLGDGLRDLISPQAGKRGA